MFRRECSEEKILQSLTVLVARYRRPISIISVNENGGRVFRKDRSEQKGPLVERGYIIPDVAALYERIPSGPDVAAIGDRGEFDWMNRIGMRDTQGGSLLPLRLCVRSHLPLWSEYP